MLEWEEELELSDKLVARRVVMDAIRSEDRNPDADESSTIQNGDRAAKDLVEHYLPHIYSLASSMISHREARSKNLYQDLVQEGVVAAMKLTNSFNLRHGSGGPGSGVRFAQYSKLAITKNMNLFLAKQSTPLKADVQKIHKTWAFLAVRGNLTEKLGRTPTDAEVEAESNIPLESVITDLQSRSDFMDLDDPDRVDIASPNGQIVKITSEHAYHTAILRQALDQLFHESLVEGILSRLGVDRMYPREPSEVAEHLEISVRAANKLTRLADTVMIHPKYRVLLKDEIVKLDWSGK